MRRIYPEFPRRPISVPPSISAVYGLRRRAWISFVFGVAMGWMLGGCTSLAPRHQTVALPVAAHYPADVISTPAEHGTDAAAIGWRDYFSDPRLRALIAQALDNNRDLRSAVLHVAEARAAYRIQRSAEWPTVGVDAIGIRTLVPAGTLTGESLLLSEYEVGISELDVTVTGENSGAFPTAGGGGPVTADAFQKQADVYGKLFGIFDRHANVVTRVTLWGISDRRSWRPTQRPLVFDGQLQPKPALQAILDVAKGK